MLSFIPGEHLLSPLMTGRYRASASKMSGCHLDVFFFGSGYRLYSIVKSTGHLSDAFGVSVTQKGIIIHSDIMDDS